jgi:hypothetical protein
MINQNLHRHASPLKAWFPAHPFRVNPDDLVQESLLFCRHTSNLTAFRVSRQLGYVALLQIQRLFPNLLHVRVGSRRRAQWTHPSNTRSGERA